MRYTVKAAARATGISESRLRTWERRYGIPRPGRSASGRRLYDDADLAVIRRMAGLVDAGMAASDAADAARDYDSSELVETREQPPTHLASSRLFEAAQSFDEGSLVQAVRECVDDMGWGAALEEALLPALNLIGSAWQTATTSVAAEHFASEIVRRELAAAMSRLPLPPGEGPVLVMACPEDERHELGLLAVALLLRQRGVRLVYLGADVPTSDLLTTIERIQPAAVCLSATTASGYASMARAARTVLATRGPRLLVGGPALQLNEAPGIRLPASLTAAAETIERLLSG